MASTDPPPQPVPLTPPPTLSTPLPAPVPAPPPPAPPPPPQPTSEVSSPKAISPPLVVPTSIGEIPAHLTTGLSIKQIRFIIDTVLAIEQSAYAEYEWKKLLSNSKEAGTIAEPVNTLSGEERKSIKKMITDDTQNRLYRYIDQIFKQVTYSEIASNQSAPSLFPTLSEHKRLRCDQALKNQEESIMLSYLILHALNRSSNKPVPPSPQTHLSTKTIAELRKLANDWRVFSYLQQNASPPSDPTPPPVPVTQTVTAEPTPTRTLG